MNHAYHYLGSDWDVGNNVCRAFEKSLIAAGYVAVEDPQSADLTFCWGQRRSYDERTLVFDLGYIRRAWDAFKNTGEYYQVSVGYLNWLPESAPPDRAKTLGVTLGPESPENDDGPIIVLGQVEGDQQHRLSAAGLKAWAERRLCDLDLANDSGVYWRPHPQAGKQESPFDIPIYKGSKESILLEASAVVTYNSTMGLECLLAGRKVFCHESAYYYDCAEEWNWGIDTRRELLNRVAYAQWTVPEMLNGECLRYYVNL